MRVVRPIFLTITALTCGEDLILLEFQPIVREDMRRAIGASSN